MTAGEHVPVAPDQRRDATIFIGDIVAQYLGTDDPAIQGTAIEQLDKSTGVDPAVVDDFLAATTQGYETTQAELAR